jgi:hypothetical protein
MFFAALILKHDGNEKKIRKIRMLKPSSHYGKEVAHS